MKKVFIVLICSVTSVLIIASCNNKKPESTSDQTASTANTVEQPKQDPVERGKYLVRIMACEDCHSPKIMGPNGPMPDESRMLSGHPANEKFPEFDKSLTQKGLTIMHGLVTAFSGPFGTSYAANLTPHETGIGNWTFENFEKAIRQGKFKGLDGSRTLLPPMPWPNYSKLTDDDLSAIFQYLKTLKPIENVVPPSVPAGQK